MDDYSWVTDEMFYNELVRNLQTYYEMTRGGAMRLLNTEGVYEIMREEFNNDVLDLLEAERDEGSHDG